MTILGIETSCDECAIAVVENGKKVLSNVIATQIKNHAPYHGVVPEIASRLHLEWIGGVYKQALEEAQIDQDQLDGIGVTNRPGLVGSLLVGLSFAKGLSFSLGIPLVGVDHLLAHLWAPQLEFDVQYPFLGLLVSGGHTLITEVRGPLEMEILGTTIDDAVGEAFDKVSKHLEMGYPGGAVIDSLASQGDPQAYRFPKPNLYKGDHTFDFSFSGLKTAVINQREQFNIKGPQASLADLAASFQKTAIDILLGKLEKASKARGITRMVAGGGVAANSYLREAMASHSRWEVYYPSFELCTDNGAMIAGLAYPLFQSGVEDSLSLNAQSRVPRFKG